MATTNYGVNHPLAVKLWSTKLMREALKQTYISSFIGSNKDSLIYRKDELGKNAGDKVTYGLRMQLTGAGVEGDATLKGNEEALTTYNDSLFINQLRHAVRSAGKMSEQRVPFDVREEARSGLSDWLADRMDTAFFNQITGNSAQTDTKYTGHNSVTAPDSDHILYPDDDTSEANVASGSASSIMKLQLIDYAVERAKTLSPLIRPLNIDGKKKFVMFLHPYQVTSLRTNTSTGQWLDITKSQIQGGLTKDNSLTKGVDGDGFIGEYNGVLLYESTRIPRTTVSADDSGSLGKGVYRAVFCGAQSASIAFGNNSSDTDPNWYEELFDYGNQLGVSARMIWGLKKNIFNGKDFGTIVVPTFASRGGNT